MFNFFEWYNYEATDEDKELAQKVDEFLPLFDDMLFKGQLTHSLVSFDDGQDLIPEELDYYGIELYKFKVEPQEDCEGMYDHESKTIYIDPNSFNDSTILHEMIHMVEMYIDDLPKFFHEILCLSFYKDISKKIPDIDDMLIGHAHIYKQFNLASSGGIHDILFYLKSLQLDLEMGYPLNTIMSYGYPEYTKEGDAND